MEVFVAVNPHMRSPSASFERLLDLLLSSSSSGPQPQPHLPAVLALLGHASGPDAKLQLDAAGACCPEFPSACLSFRLLTRGSAESAALGAFLKQSGIPRKPAGQWRLDVFIAAALGP